MHRFKLLLALAIVLAIAAFFAFDLARFLRLDYFLARKDEIETWRAAHPLVAAGVFVATYVAVAALSLPGAALMTLAGGALFGVAARPLSGALPPLFGGALA